MPSTIPAELVPTATNLVDMVINGECSFSYVLGWADRALNGAALADFRDYVRSF